uniref:ATP synthase complex subunit 8 n=1 Tax=Niptus hololeucus TaxID=1588567 RepID=A0A343C503_9COLE|nr:ATP synthase F0 subunit 8 [Niptus hololeucus]
MPQMAPLSWSILYLLFLMIFLMINMINYYNKNYMLKNKNFKKNKFINWKW